VHLIGYERRRVCHGLLKSNRAITAERYQQQLIERETSIIAQRKRKMILLHNARPHVAKVIKDTLSAL